MKILYIIAFLLIVIVNVNAQDNKIDSLKKSLSEKIHDTVRVKTLLNLSQSYLGDDNIEALKYANDAKIIANKINYGKGIAGAYKLTGISYYFQGRLKEAMIDWLQSLHVYDSLNNKLGMANILNNIGSVYYDQGDNTNALENYLKSLRLSKEINNDLRIATALVNIGNVYMDKPQTHDLALEYFLQALLVSEKLKDERTIGSINLNIGNIYNIKNNKKLAQYYLNKALVQLKDQDLESSVLTALARIESDNNKNFKKSLYFHDLAYKSALTTGNMLYATQALSSTAETYIKFGNNNVAIEYYKKALPSATEIGANLELKNIYGGLAEIFSGSLKFDSAYKYLELYSNIKDTLFNEDADRRLSVLRLDYELEKKETQISQLKTVNNLNTEVITRQNIIRNLIIGGLLVISIFFYNTLRQKRKIKIAQQRSEELLLNILPEEIANELKAKGEAEARQIDEVSVLFTDFSGFTSLSEKLSPKELVKDIHECFSAFDNIMDKYHLEKIKTIGDSYMAASGLPTPNEQHAQNAINAAKEIIAFIEKIKTEKIANNLPYFEIRIGIHTGPVVAGIVGLKKFAYDIWGDTVNTASRMESSGEVGQINISENTYKLVKDQFNCEYRGEIAAKNKGSLKMYFVK